MKRVIGCRRAFLTLTVECEHISGFGALNVPFNRSSYSQNIINEAILKKSHIKSILTHFIFGCNLQTG